MIAFDRVPFETSRLMDFFSEKELTAQCGHERSDWPLVVLKELIDNALDASEDAGVAPQIRVAVDGSEITVADRGPGIPPDVVAGILKFDRRVSSREAYVSPCRGAQGNAGKVLTAMPFVLSGGAAGRTRIAARGIRHEISVRVNQIAQQPIIDHQQTNDRKVRIGTSVTVEWPIQASSILKDQKERFLLLADDYTWLNPHLRLETHWDGERQTTKPGDVGWRKWLSRYPTSAHWYRVEHLERLAAAYLSHAGHGAEMPLGDFLRLFDGFSGSSKRKLVTDAVGLTRQTLCCQMRFLTVAQGGCSPMWTCIQPYAIAILSAATVFLMPRLGKSADGNESGNQQHAQRRNEQEFAEKIEEYNELVKQRRFNEAILVGKEARLLNAKNTKTNSVNIDAIRFELVLVTNIPGESDDRGPVEAIRRQAGRLVKIADGTVDRLVFGQIAADGRLLLVAQLEEKIEAVDRICGLTDSQRRKLQLAGRGDIKRLCDRIETLRAKFEDVDAAIDENVEARGQLAGALRREAEVVRRSLRSGLFEQESLFAKARQTTLTPGQSAAFDTSRSNSPALDGTWEWHFFAVDNDGWMRVQPRRRQ